MKPGTAALAATAMVVPLLSLAAPVQAAPAVPTVEQGKWCDTDRFEKTIKYGGKKEVTVIHVAKGCVAYHVNGDQTCSVLTLTQSKVAAQVDLGKRARVEANWRSDPRKSRERIETGCNMLGENTGLDRLTQWFTGTFKINRRWPVRDVWAVPGLKVDIHASGITSAQDSEWIVQMTRVGSWRFTKANNPAKDSGSDKDNNPAKDSGSDKDNSRDSGSGGDQGGYQGITAGEATIPDAPPTTTGRNGR